jgi:hypothetical protein
MTGRVTDRGSRVTGFSVCIENTTIEEPRHLLKRLWFGQDQDR